MKKIAEFRIRLGLFALTLASLAVGFHELLLKHAPSIFADPNEDLSFGWFVPCVSVYVLWVEREKLVKSLGAPSLVGAVLTLPFLFTAFLGVRGIQVRFEILALIGLLITLPWAFFGRETAKRVLFPAGFLLFCIPLATFLDIVTVHLRLLATGLAGAILTGVGAAVQRTGTMIFSTSGSFAIDVAAPCSGLRSIFALMALTACYAYFNQPTLLRRAILFATSIPLAILGNVMRILTICLVGAYASPDFATGFYHDYSGYVVFVVAIALMLACGKLVTVVGNRLTARKPAAASTPRGAAPASASKSAAPPAVGLLAVLSLGIVLVMGTLASTPAPTVCAAPVVALGELPGYSSEPLEASEAELTVLPADTQIVKRQYFASNGNAFTVSVVIGGTSKSSIHRPELCLPAQGFLMTRPHTLRLPRSVWRVICLDGGVSRPSLGFAYTFFNQAGYRTSSHLERIFRDVWDRSVHNRIDRWVMVTVGGTRSDDAGLSEFLTLLEKLLK